MDATSRKMDVKNRGILTLNNVRDAVDKADPADKTNQADNADQADHTRGYPVLYFFWALFR